MSLADYPNQFAVFCHNSCTKLMADKRVWRIKRWRINENSLYLCQTKLSEKVNNCYIRFSSCYDNAYHCHMVMMSTVPLLCMMCRYGEDQLQWWRALHP